MQHSPQCYWFLGEIKTYYNKDIGRIFLLEELWQYGICSPTLKDIFAAVGVGGGREYSGRGEDVVGELHKNV